MYWKEEIRINNIGSLIMNEIKSGIPNELGLVDNPLSERLPYTGFLNYCENFHLSPVLFAFYYLSNPLRRYYIHITYLIHT